MLLRNNHPNKQFVAEKDSLEEHSSSHTTLDLYKCGMCNKSFSLKSNMTAHMRSVHCEDWPYKCGLCNKCYVSKNYLIHHFKVYHGNQPQNIQQNASLTMGQKDTKLGQRIPLPQKNNESFVPSTSMNNHQYNPFLKY